MLAVGGGPLKIQEPPLAKSGGSDGEVVTNNPPAETNEFGPK